MSLSFLQKKSWHTAKTSNIEKVWIQEENKKKEDAKLAELLQQRKEEREEEDMLKLTGRGDEAEARSMNWMYQGVGKSEVEKEEDAERFLLGEKYKGKEKDKSEIEIVNDSRDVNGGGNTGIVGGLFVEKSVNERNEEFQRRLNDPIEFMMRGEIDKRREVRKEMEVKAALVGGVVLKKGKREKKEKKKKSKKSKKEKKKKSKNDKKSKKKRRKDESDSDSSDNSDSDVEGKVEKVERVEKVEEVRKKPEGYGLKLKGGGIQISSSSSSSRVVEVKRDYRKEKDAEREKEEREREERRGRKRGRGEITDEERKRRVEDMMNEGEKMIGERVKRAKDHLEGVEELLSEETGGEKGGFLRDIGRGQHGLGEGEGLEERMGKMKGRVYKGDGF